MLGGHLPELLFLVMLLMLLGAVGLVWVFGLAVRRGITRGKGKYSSGRPEKPSAHEVELLTGAALRL